MKRKSTNKSTNQSTMGSVVNPTEYKIYEYLIDGKLQSWITKTLRVDKAYVSRTTKKLLRLGYIKKAINKRRHVVYRATPYKLTNPTPVENTTLRWERRLPPEIDLQKALKECVEAWNIAIQEKDINVHHISYKFPVVQKPKRSKIKWDNITDFNGVTQRFLKYWDETVGDISIRYSENRYVGDDIVIWLPSYTVPAGQHAQEETIKQEYIWKASAWVQKLLYCRLGVPEIYREPHYATEVREPELIELIESGKTFNFGTVHFDASPPEKVAHFESTDFDKTKCYSELPDRVMKLETTMDAVLGAINGMAKGMEYIAGSVTKLAEGQEIIMETMNKMNEEHVKFVKSIEEFMGFRRKVEKKLEEESQQKMYG